MGLCWSNGWTAERGQGSGSHLECFSHCLLPETPQESTVAGDRKYLALEQKIASLELRLNITDEANQRLYNKWSMIEDRFQQLEGLHQGDMRALQVRCQAVEQRLESLSLSVLDRYDDIIVVEE